MTGALYASASAALWRTACRASSERPPYIAVVTRAEEWRKMTASRGVSRRHVRRRQGVLERAMGCGLPSRARRRHPDSITRATRRGGAERTKGQPSGPLLYGHRRSATPGRRDRLSARRPRGRAVRCVPHLLAHLMTQARTSCSRLLWRLPPGKVVLSALIDSPEQPTRCAGKESPQ
jgi:hypothetical protein